jgi:hypothetical protein
MHKDKRLIDGYRFKGYEPSENLTGIFGDPKARVIHLKRQEKNNLPTVRHLIQELLRSKDTLRARPFQRRIRFIPNALPIMLANDAAVRPSAMLQKNCILIGKLSKNLKNSIYKRNFAELVKRNPKSSALTKYLYAKDTRTESWLAIWNDISPFGMVE